MISRTQNTTERRRGISSIDLIAAITIFTAVVILASQLLVSVANYLRAQRETFLTSQMKLNVLEVVDTIRFEDLDQPKVDTAVAVLASQDRWEFESNVDVIDDDSKRIDISVSRRNRVRSNASVSSWRFRREANTTNE